jgi:hypothetical protein
MLEGVQDEAVQKAFSNKIPSVAILSIPGVLITLLPYTPADSDISSAIITKMFGRSEIALT